MRVRTSSSTTPTVPEGILDIYTGAAAAYSLRKLRKAYTGAAIRIRRDDDNLEVDVPFDGFNGLGASGFETFLRSFCGGFGTNYILGSETFSPSFWIYTNSTLISNAGQSPIATSNASKLVETTATGEHNFSYSIGGYGGGARLSTSYYVKAAERNFAYVRLQEDIAPFSKAGVVVNLTTLQTQADTSVPNNEFSNISVYATNVGNGWVRISVAANVNTLNSVSTVVGAATSLTTLSYAGNATSGILIWGAQAQDGNTGIYDWKGNTASASAFVTTWYDQSGNARHATQTTAANQPRVVNAGVVDKVNGRVTARYMGNQYFGGFMFAAIDLTVHSLFYAADGTGAAQAFDFRNTSNGSPLVDDQGTSGRGYRIRDEQGRLTSVFSSPSTLLRQVSGIKSTTNLNGYLNGFLQASFAFQGSITGINTVGIGTNGAGPGVNNYTGSIPELFIYPSDQSANRAAIESNIMSYYSIT